MFARIMRPFRGKNDLEARHPSRWSEKLNADLDIDREEEWLGWDAWVFAERF